MKAPKLIEIREAILADNAGVARDVRDCLGARGVFLVNVMGSPGAGKTTLILKTAEMLKGAMKVAVIEGDCDSSIDAERVMDAGIPAVQIRTGGFCHLDASMVKAGLEALESSGTLPPLVFVENIGNLICTAQVDTGAHLNIALLSLPEGDDKPAKYPVMFRNADALVVTKTDYGTVARFDQQRALSDALRLNRDLRAFSVCAVSGDGMEAWVSWLLMAVRVKLSGAAIQ